MAKIAGSSPQNLVVTMQDWIGSPAGRYIREWEETHYRKLTADIFGFHALQIGFPGISTLNESRIKNRWLSCSSRADMGRYRKSADGAPVGTTAPLSISISHRFEELPFASQSIDLVILPHILEFSESPHNILREVERILVPDGKLIVSGFNPLSLWGIRQKFGTLSGFHFLPEYARFICLSRLKDWLMLLGLETDRGHFGCYIPPFQSKKWQSRFTFMEKAGDRWWPFLGAVYMVQAVKRVRGVRLVGLVDQARPRQIFHHVPVGSHRILEVPVAEVTEPVSGSVPSLADLAASSGPSPDPSPGSSAAF